MIELNLILKHEKPNEKTYKQDFPDGFVHVYLTDTPKSRRCYVELGANKEENKYRFFNSKFFYTVEAFEIAKDWISKTLIKYEKVFMGN
jgi:hypothetical protein